MFWAAQRLKIPVTLVANRMLQLPPSRLIDAVRVSPCLKAADHYLLQHTTAGDLVITADILLAAGLVARGVAVLNSRGELYTKNNISERLAFRNLIEELRATGVSSGGPAPYDNRDKQAFANQLDRWLGQRPYHQRSS